MALIKECGKMLDNLTEDFRKAMGAYIDSTFSMEELNEITVSYMRRDEADSATVVNTQTETETKSDSKDEEGLIKESM